MTTDQMDFEVRFSDVGDDGSIEGVAVRFDTVDTYGTSFAPEAFRGLDGRSIPMLFNHNPGEVVGSWSSFQVRNGGLTAKGRLNLEVARAREVRAMLKAGDISGLSIGFSRTKQRPGANGSTYIIEARLYEVSIVAFPSVPGSGVTKVRSSSEANGIEEGAAAFVAACRAATLSIKGN